MAIKRHKRGDRVYLAEYKSIREGKKIRSVFVRYIGPEGGVLPGRMPSKRVIDRVEVRNAVRAGDVGLLWRLAKELDMVNIIDRYCCNESPIPGASPGKYLTMWAINRLLDPESCTQLEKWVPATVLPDLAGIPADAITKDAYLDSLDFVCSWDSRSGGYIDHTASIDDSLYQKWRSLSPLPDGSRETVAYDLTSILFFGVDCPIAEFGYTSNEKGRKQVNLSLIVSKHDKFPLSHFVYSGSRNGVSTIDNLIERLSSSKIDPGTIIWDRGCISKEHVQTIEKLGWKLISGIPIISKESKRIIEIIEVPIGPETHARKSEKGHLYAIKVIERIYGQKRNVVVYTNPTRRLNSVDAENEELSTIGAELDSLNRMTSDVTIANLRAQAKEIVGTSDEFVRWRVTSSSGKPKIVWKFKKRTIDANRKSLAKWLLLATDSSLSAKEIVDAYMEKDFIEKVFRTVKTLEEVQPVRHRLQQRVRAYLFVCVLAYRLLAVLQSKLEHLGAKDDRWERASALLTRLSIVQKSEIVFGGQTKTIYLNLRKTDQELLEKMGMAELFKASMAISGS